MQEHFRLLDEEDSAPTLRLFESPQYGEHDRVLKAFAYLGDGGWELLGSSAMINGVGAAELVASAVPGDGRR
jgi:hypothetical protein